MFARLIGNSTNREILRRLVENKRYGATYIFAGPEGVGKRQFAWAFAKAANCQNPPKGEVDSCDICPSCFRIDQSSHPDVWLLEPDEKGTIRVGPARDFAREIRFRPYEGKQRFFLIDCSEKLRAESANALLKTLEEPPPTSNIILLTAQPDALLPTVRSRSQQLTFAPLPMDEMEKYVLAQGRPKGEARLLARLSEGSIGRLASIDLSDYLKERGELLELAELLAGEGNRHRLIKAAEYFAKQQEKEVFERKLILLLKIVRDMTLLHAGRDRETIMNVDEAERLEALASKIGFRRLSLWAEGLNEVRRNLVVNINRQVAMDGLFQRLASGR
jgi:DNA polymerase III subunit delta'